MKFKVQTSDWTAGLSLASSITPAPIDAQGTAGYLCVVRGEKCYLYSEDKKQRLRVSVPIFDVEGEGAFVFPTGPHGDLRYVDGWVEFEPGEESGASVVWCRRDTGNTRKGGVHKIITFKSTLLRSLDADFSKALKQASMPVVVLKEALAMTRGYLADSKDPEAKPEFVNLQLFGPDSGAGNGYMRGYQTNLVSYFYSPELEDKPLFVYSPRIPLLMAFLSKSNGDVDVYKSENSTYFMNGDEQVIGWSNQDYAGGNYGYYDVARDRHIFRIPRNVLQKELRYVRSTLPSDRNKAQISYDPETQALRFLASNTIGEEVESLPVPVIPLVAGDEGCWGPGDLGSTEGFEINFNLDWMTQIVEDTKHPRDVLLAVARSKKADQFFFRIIESYSIDVNGKYVEMPAPDQKVYACQAQRFVPSKQ